MRIHFNRYSALCWGHRIILNGHQTWWYGLSLGMTFIGVVRRRY